VGTSSPAVKLHVQSASAGATALRLTDAVRGTINIDFPATSQVRLDVGAAEKMLFSSGASTILTINDINSGGGLAITGTIKATPSTGSEQFALDTSGTNLTVANNATAYPFGNSNNFSGIIIINDVSVTGSCGLFIAGGGGQISLISASTAGTFSTTSGTSGRVNVYVTGNVITIENKYGSSVVLNVMALRTRAGL
jgi:hypothetical protein